MKNKTCLLIISSTNSTYDTTKNGVKVSNIRELKNEFEKENIELKISTYKGKNAILNFENDEKNGKRVCNLHANPQQLGQ